MNENKYLSRNWILALLFGVTGCLAFAFTSKLSGTEFVGLATGLTGIFRAGDAAVNWMHTRKSDAS